MFTKYSYANISQKIIEKDFIEPFKIPPIFSHKNFFSNLIKKGKAPSRPSTVSHLFLKSIDIKNFQKKIRSVFTIELISYLVRWATCAKFWAMFRITTL